MPHLKYSPRSWGAKFLQRVYIHVSTNTWWYFTQCTTAVDYVCCPGDSALHTFLDNRIVLLGQRGILITTHSIIRHPRGTKQWHRKPKNGEAIGTCCRGGG